VSKLVNKLTLLTGGAILTAAAAGSIIGGLGPLGRSATEIIWSPATPTATLTATAEPTTFATQEPTRAAVTPPRPTRTAQPAAATATPQPSEAPSAPPSAAPSDLPTVIEYIVQPGDVLFRLAQRFNTTNDAIVTLNPEINPDSLTVGARLRIPSPATNGQQP
jgi:LysM repeat protein